MSIIDKIKYGAIAIDREGPIQRRPADVGRVDVNGRYSRRYKVTNRYTVKVVLAT